MIINTMLPIYINEIINERKAKKISQYKFADIIGVSRTHYNNIETGKYPPNGALLQTIADELGLVIHLTKPT